MYKLFLLILLLVSPASAKHRRRVPEWRAFMPTPDSLLKQNAAVDALGVPRVRTDAEMRELIGTGQLLRIERNEALSVHIPSNRAYLHPLALGLLYVLAEEYHAWSGKALQVNSAVRTVQVQNHLRRFNRNAAPAEGKRASAHESGLAFDLQRRGLSRAQLRFLQIRLLYYHAIGRAIVEEEFGKAPCIHVVAIQGETDETSTEHPYAKDRVEELP